MISDMSSCAVIEQTKVRNNCSALKNCTDIYSLEKGKVKTRLSVNINKIATIRNARGGNVPDLVKMALDIEAFGADGITVHPRPDERHIRLSDVFELKERIRTEFNIEGYPDARFLKLISDVRPAQATLVPDPPGVLTSNAGWDTLAHQQFLSDVIGKIKSLGVRTSVFIGTRSDLIETAAKLGVDRIELYTGPFAEHFETDKVAAVKPFVEAAECAHRLGLGVNAGHDLSLKNLQWFKENVAHLAEVSIGHALISDALYYGLENTVQLYKRLLE